MTEKETITKKELAERWGVTKRTIERLEKADRIPRGIRISPKVKFWRIEDIRAHEEELAQRAPAD